MSKKIIIILTLIFSLGRTSSFLIIRYRSKNQESLEVKEEEKKEESKFEQQQEEEKKGEKEEITSIPWTYSWKGAICSFLISLFISLIISLLASSLCDRKIKGASGDSNNILPFIFLYSILYLVPFETLISPFVLAIKKFGKRNYFQRLPKVYSTCKIVIDVPLAVIGIIFIILIYFFSNDADANDGESGFLKNLKNAYLIKYR